jgi:hypothetical protein
MDANPFGCKIILLPSAKLTMSKALSYLLYAYDPISPVFTLQALLTFVLSKYFLIHDSLG